MAGIHSTDERDPNTDAVPPRNEWTCSLCGETMTGAQRVWHLLDHD